MKKKNGFTLVELLAVIVVLAIIMIIAIPSVLDVMNNARRSSFALYIEKVVTAVQTQYVYDANAGSISGAGYYVYDIKNDLSLTSTGDYNGYVVVDAKTYGVDNVHYYINMYDSNYMIIGWDVVDAGMPEADDENAIRPYQAGDVNEKISTQVRACKTSIANTLGDGTSVDNIECYNRKGYKLSETAAN